MGRVFLSTFVCLSLFTIQNIFSLTSDCNNGACTPLSTAEKQAILDIHNELRDRVAGGALAAEGPTGHPAATDMNYLIWDDGLEAVAQAFAESCPGLNHNSDRGIEYLSERNSGGGTKWGPDSQYMSSFCNSQDCIYTGENLAVNSAAYTIGSITSQIETGWWDEYKVWTFGIHSDGCPNGEQCGHYTQMAWANTRYIGCGYTNGCNSEISEWASMFVCNYFPAGNFNAVPPYTSGTACSNCMSDRTECQSSYDSRSNTAGSYTSQPYNKLCDGGACPTMCDGGSYNRDTCDGTGCTPSTIDCNDGTISKTAGRNICGTPSPTTATPTKRPTTTSVPTTRNPTTATPTTTAPTPSNPTTTAPTTDTICAPNNGISIEKCLESSIIGATCCWCSDFNQCALSDSSLFDDECDPICTLPPTSNPTATPTKAPITSNPTTSEINVCSLIDPYTIERCLSVDESCCWCNDSEADPTCLFNPSLPAIECVLLICTLPPTTAMPTTTIPTTSTPTTNLPTTNLPTTLLPTTINPTTSVPSTSMPTTTIPTTSIPMTSVPSTSIPTTINPTTNNPTTNNPTTLSLITLIPTTNLPTTNNPTILSPTTLLPTTNLPTTNLPTTINPTTLLPTTNNPTTLSPTTKNSTTSQPTTNLPTTVLPTNFTISRINSPTQSPSINSSVPKPQSTPCGSDISIIEFAVSRITQVIIAIIALWFVVGYFVRFGLFRTDCDTHQTIMIYSVLGCLFLAFAHGCVASFILTNVFVTDAETILRFRCNALFWHQIFILQLGQLLVYIYFVSKLKTLKIFQTRMYYFLLLFISCTILFTTAILPWYSIPIIQTGDCNDSKLIICINSTPSDAGIYEEYVIFISVNVLMQFVLLFVFIYQFYQLCTESGCCTCGRNKFTYRILSLGMVLVFVHLIEFVLFCITEQTFHSLRFIIYTVIIMFSFRICDTYKESGDSTWCCWCCIDDKVYSRLNVETQQEQECSDGIDHNGIGSKDRGPYNIDVCSPIKEDESIGLI